MLGSFFDVVGMTRCSGIKLPIISQTKSDITNYFRRYTPPVRNNAAMETTPSARHHQTQHYRSQVVRLARQPRRHHCGQKPTETSRWRRRAQNGRRLQAGVKEIHRLGRLIVEYLDIREGRLPMFIKSVDPTESTGDIADLYAAKVESSGMVMEATQCWSARPDIIIPVEDLLNKLRDGFSLGLLNYKLITFAAAQHVPSSYCSHVYFRLLSEEIMEGPVSVRSRWQCSITPRKSAKTPLRSLTRISKNCAQSGFPI